MSDYPKMLFKDGDADTAPLIVNSKEEEKAAKEYKVACKGQFMVGAIKVAEPDYVEPAVNEVE